jgi:hypothetical protein
MTVVELTEDELEQEREAAAARAVERMMRELAPALDRLERTLRLARGLVFKSDLCAWLDVSSSTIARWGIEPIDRAPGQRNLYWIPDVIDHLRGAGDEAAHGAQERLDAVFRTVASRSPSGAEKARDSTVA